VRAKDVLGRYGEEVAARFLAGEGLEVLARNWRCASGEIDLIALEGAVLVVCEVKTRRDDAYGGPFAAITRLKLNRLRRLAGIWLEENGGVAEVRVDVVGVWPGADGVPRVEHLRGVL